MCKYLWYIQLSKFRDKKLPVMVFIYGGMNYVFIQWYAFSYYGTYSICCIGLIY